MCTSMGLGTSAYAYVATTFGTNFLITVLGTLRLTHPFRKRQNGGTRGAWVAICEPLIILINDSLINHSPTFKSCVRSQTNGRLA